ncbi:MAG TPA: phosphate ABC transporter substrate-binding protein [Gammaproteobacteria bacterium]|nr:phosphate ABC transporter substrate-binding protein [Gammaproteobacteria bacterium]
MPPLISFLFSASLFAAELSVIVNANHALKSATAQDIKKLYLGKISTLSGTKLIPVDQADGKPVRTLFYDKVCGKNPNQLKAYWAQLIFTGGGSPPPVLDGDHEVISWVSRNENAIGYVDARMLNDSVKPIFSVIIK